MSRRGFTLIEILVALVLLGLAMSLAGSTLWTAVSIRDGQRKAAEADQQVRVTRDFLRETLGSVVSERAGAGDLFLLEPDGTGHRLGYTTRGGSGFGWGPAVRAVVLYVDRDPATEGEGLTARVLHPVAGGVHEDTLALVPKAGALRVRLRDASGRWRSEWPDAAAAPSAVEVRLSPAAGQMLPRAASVPLRVSLR